MENKKKYNVSFKDNPVTTVLGSIFVFAGLGLFIVPVFYAAKSNIEWFVPAAMCFLGVLLIISPDTFLGIAKKGADKLVDKS